MGPVVSMCSGWNYNCAILANGTAAWCAPHAAPIVLQLAGLGRSLWVDARHKNRPTRVIGYFITRRQRGLNVLDMSPSSLALKCITHTQLGRKRLWRVHCAY